MARFALRLVADQEGLLFQPRREQRGTPRDVGLDGADVELPGASGTVRGWWIPGEPGRGAFLFLPGAIGNSSHELPTFAFLRGLGAGVLAIDYPGYGRSDGRPTIAACRRAAADGFRFLAAARPAPGPLFVYGRSLGCLFAAALAAEQGAGLVFHNGFPSVPDLAACFLPRPLVAVSCYVRVGCAPALAARRAPALFLHARGDEVIPPALGRRAFDLAAAPKRFLELAGGHFGDGWQRDPGVRAAFADLLSGAAAGWGGRSPERSPEETA
jgi:pimeloyl-ACP methyl ester carboxylesterase